MRIVGKKNTVYRSLKADDGLILENCQHLILSKCTLSGGYCNLYLLNCRDCAIRDCSLSKPNGQPDKDGNGPHSILLDNCRNCRVIRCSIERTPESEMGIGLYKCTNCVADANHIWGGGTRQSADAITIDWGSEKCVIRHNQIDLRNDQKTKSSGHSAIVVASGHKHNLVVGKGYIKGSIEDYPIAVTSYYDADGNPVEDDDVNALKVSAFVRVPRSYKQLVYAGPRATVTFLG